MRHHTKNQLVNTVQRNSCRLLSESYETCKYIVNTLFGQNAVNVKAGGRYT